MKDTPEFIEIQYDKLSSIDLTSLVKETEIRVLFDEIDKNSIMTILIVDELNGEKVVYRTTEYASIKEFSTVAMKELLTLYAKNTVIASDKTYYHRDDPKLHAYLSKLSYPGIESICKNLVEFSRQFKEGLVTMNIPKFGKKHINNHSKTTN